MPRPRITNEEYDLVLNSRKEKSNTLIIFDLHAPFVKNGYLDFDINNYDGKEYHIDHIIPCDVFNLKCSYHQKICFHYTNLQILKAKENIKKSNKIIEV